MKGAPKREKKWTPIEIIPGQEYRIRGHSQYLAKKYGTPNPIIKIEDTDLKVLGCKWHDTDGNPACIFFGARAGIEKLACFGPVYYGKIGSLGELVCKNELEIVE